jgi:hypothetical protein
MGGGALKLEAVQIRQLPVPTFEQSALTEIRNLGHTLAGCNPAEAVAVVARLNRIVLSALSGRDLSLEETQSLAARLGDFAARMKEKRQRG